MSANLTPAYLEAEKRYRSAETPEEKVEALQEMLSAMPKHKGTDKLRAELRTKIAKLTKEAAKAQGAARRGGVYHVPREGAGQIALIGVPNVGKSQLLAFVTDASPDIGTYPFTTKSPQPGMMKFENVQIQLVDMPSITDQDARPWFASVLRTADALAVMIDVSADPIEQMSKTIVCLARYRVEISGFAVNDNSERLPIEKKALVLANKTDLDKENLNLSRFHDEFGQRMMVIPISAETGDGLEKLGKEFFDRLDVVRVFTKTPGIQANLNDPMIMKKGATVEDAAEAVHKDFRRGLKYALIWGSGKFDGQRAKRDHILEDGDIIALHA